MQESLALRARRTFGVSSQEGFVRAGSRTQRASQPSLVVQLSCDLTRETLILIYLLFLLQCSCHLSLSLFAYMAEQLGRPPAPPTPVPHPSSLINLMGEGGEAGEQREGGKVASRLFP